ncbi:P-loop containing nucleoside triphosphate hydrolase protein, partial [Amylostereum chailletii]
YLELGSICKKFPTVPITIASASITPFTCDKILSLLGMDKSELEIISSTLNRPNLRYHVVPSMRSHKATIEAIVQFITNHHLEEPGIIYCTTKEKCDIIVTGLVSYELKAEAYYSTANNKPQIVQAWRNNTCHIIVATIAFGLGIDKPDVYDWKAPQRHWWYSTHTPGQSPEQSAHQALSTLSMSQFSIDLVNCRRTLLLKNFGEEFDPSLCNSCCDNCSLKYAVGAYDFAQAAKDFVAMIKE